MAIYSDTTWYVGSVHYAAVTVRPQNTAVAAGVVRRQFTTPAVNSERCFVCIIAGTTANVTDATWNLTRGNKTTDGTATWMECTGGAAFNGDSTNVKTWTQFKAFVGGTGPDWGNVIKRNNGASYQIVTTTGTLGSSEPAFSDTAGVTTTDGGTTWTSLGPVGNFPAWGAPHARLANAYASNWGGLAGFTFFVANNHAETQSTAIALSSPATSGGGATYVICVDRTAALPPVEANYTTGASISTTGASDLTLRLASSPGAGVAYYQGIAFNAGSGASYANVVINRPTTTQIFKNCAFALTNTASGPSPNIVFGDSTGPCKAIWNNCTVQFGHVGQAIYFNQGSLDWSNTPSALQGAIIPTQLFNFGTARDLSLVCRGLDLSALSTRLISDDPGVTNSIVFEDCKFHASLTRYGASSGSGYAAVPVITVRCDSGAANYKSTRDEYAGGQSTETSITRVGGATDGTTPSSVKIVTNTQATFLTPYRMLRLAAWNDVTGVNRTVTICGLVNAAALPLNSEIWMEVQYLGSSSSSVASFKTTAKSHPLATAASVISDGSTWNLPAAFTPAALTGLIGWWDASVTASLTLSGSDILSVADQSGGGNTMNWSNNKPTYSATGINSKPAIVCAVGQALQATPFPIGTGTTLTFWYVGTAGLASSNTGGRALSYGAAGATADYDNAGSWLMQRSNSTTMQFYRVTATTTTAAVAVDPAVHRYIGTINSSGLTTLYVDGVVSGTPGTRAGNWVSGGKLNIARNGFNTTEFFAGPFGEVGIATGYSDATTVAQLDNYLLAKWGGSAGPSVPPWTPFKLTATLASPQPQQKGYIYVAVRAAKLSTTYYIDPLLVLGVDVTAPTITSSSTVSVNEEVVLAHSLIANESVTWSLVGGADQARFEISGSTLRWLSNGTKDYEAPNDADANNVYQVTVRAADFSGYTTDQAISVTVLDMPSAEASAFLARTSGLDTTHVNAYIALIDGLVTDGVWAKLDMLHIYATQNSTTALMNLISTSYSGSPVNSPVFTADRGYLSGGSLGVIYTGFAPTAAPSPKFVQNSAHTSVWSLTNTTDTGVAMGTHNGAGYSYCGIQPKYTDGSAYFRINGANNTAGVAMTDSRGHCIANRSGSAAVQGYKNGVSVLTNSDTSVQVNISEFITLAINNNGTRGNYSAHQLAMASIGSSLDATQAAAFYNRLRTYMTAVGVP